MTARDDFPELADEADRAWTPDHWPEEAQRALATIDRLRRELETCERRNEQLRIACDEAVTEVARYRAAISGPRRASRR